MADFRDLEILSFEYKGEDTFISRENAEENNLYDYITKDILNFYISDTELECVEDFAKENFLIQSEEELSERFDQWVEESDAETQLMLRDDKVMFRQEFSNFADFLTKDNQLHPIQYNQYDYVGSYHY